MNTKKNIIAIVTGCTLAAAATATVALAGKVPGATVDLSALSNVYVNLEGSHTPDGMGHFQFELQDSGIGMAPDQTKADAILSVSLAPPVNKGDLGIEVGYTAALTDTTGKTLYTDSGDEFADTPSEACKDIADHLASDIADEREDAVDELE